MSVVYKIFIQWLVHESVNVTWDYFWNIFISDKIVLNLVHLASVDKWSHVYLYHMYKDKYIEHLRTLRRYQEVTAWYDTLHEFDAQTVKDDNISLIFDLQEYEATLCTETCEKCEFYEYLDEYTRHLRFCYNLNCSWCYSIERCFHCSSFTSCIFHRQVMIGLNPHKVCKCKTERIVSDEQFVRKLKQIVPDLRKAGWKFIMYGDIPKLEIYPPGEYQEEFLSYEEELECLYFGE